MFFVLSKLLDVFLSPYFWAVLFLAIAIPWRRRTVLRHWKRRRAIGIAGLVVLFVFSTEPVANGLLRNLETAAPSTYAPERPYDVVVLLGGVTDERVAKETGTPNYNDNVERLVETHRLLASGQAKYAIVSGAAMDASFAAFGEARVLAAQMREWGIAEDRIILEEKARNTRENAVYTKAIVDARRFERVVIVTSAFHMRRAHECFNAVGLAVDTRPVDFRTYRDAPASFVPRAHHLATSTSAIRELFGWRIYRAQGYAKP